MGFASGYYWLLATGCNLMLWTARHVLWEHGVQEPYGRLSFELGLWSHFEAEAERSTVLTVCVCVCMFCISVADETYLTIDLHNAGTMARCVRTTRNLVCLLACVGLPSNIHNTLCASYQVKPHRLLTACGHSNHVCASASLLRWYSVSSSDLHV